MSHVELSESSTNKSDNFELAILLSRDVKKTKEIEINKGKQKWFDVPHITIRLGSFLEYVDSPYMKTNLIGKISKTTQNKNIKITKESYDSDLSNSIRYMKIESELTDLLRSK